MRKYVLQKIKKQSLAQTISPFGNKTPKIFETTRRVCERHALRFKKRQRERAAELVTLYDLRMAVQKTQKQMAETLGVRQDSISRLENRSDMLLSTLRRYVEGMGGTLALVAQFPDRPPMVIHKLGETTAQTT